MARTMEDDHPHYPIPLLVLAMLDVVFVLFGGLIFDGLALFWCHLLSSAVLVAFIVPWLVHDVRLLAASRSKGRYDRLLSRTARKKRTFVITVEAALFALVIAALTYGCIIYLKDLPWLSSPKITQLTDVNCYRSNIERVPWSYTLSGTDSTGEEIGLIASSRNNDDFNAARQEDGTDMLVSATVQYLPNSRTVIRADFSSIGLANGYDTTDYAYLSEGYKLIEDLSDSTD
jgi:hypothetical protein